MPGCFELTSFLPVADSGSNLVLEVKHNRHVAKQAELKALLETLN